MADCSQGGLVRSYLFLSSHKFLWILENHSFSGVDLFPGHLPSLTSAPLSLARSEAGLGRARTGYHRGEEGSFGTGEVIEHEPGSNYMPAIYLSLLRLFTLLFIYIFKISTYLGHHSHM